MYALIHNNQIEVGPRSWIRGAFKEYLEETEDPILIEEAKILPRETPTEILSGTNWKILPVKHIHHEDMHPVFDQPVGPFWTIHEDHITGEYQKTQAPLASCQGRLKNMITETRKYWEECGFYYAYNNEYIKFATDLKSRTAVQLGVPGQWKVRVASSLETEPVVTREEFIYFDQTLLDNIKAAAQQHIHNCFTWESETWNLIDSATLHAELDGILQYHMTFPTPIFGV